MATGRLDPEGWVVATGANRCEAINASGHVEGRPFDGVYCGAKDRLGVPSARGTSVGA